MKVPENPAAASLVPALPSIWPPVLKGRESPLFGLALQTTWLQTTSLLWSARTTRAYTHNPQYSSSPGLTVICHIPLLCPEWAPLSHPLLYALPSPEMSFYLLQHGRFIPAYLSRPKCFLPEALPDLLSHE